MIAQICEGRKKNKEVTIHNGTHKGRPADLCGGRPKAAPIMGGVFLGVFISSMYGIASSKYFYIFGII